MTDRLSEQDEVTLSVLAIIDRTTSAEQRRQAVRAWCSSARRDPQVAEIVRLILASRRGRRPAGNVVSIGGRHA